MYYYFLYHVYNTWYNTLLYRCIIKSQISGLHLPSHSGSINYICIVRAYTQNLIIIFCFICNFKFIIHFYIKCVLKTNCVPTFYIFFFILSCTINPNNTIVFFFFYLYIVVVYTILCQTRKTII